MGPEESGKGTNQATDSIGGVREAEQGIPRANPEAFLEFEREQASRFIDLHQRDLNQKSLSLGARQPVIRNLFIQQLTPEQLHGNWAFIKRGAEDILKKVGQHTDWIPEDLYAALRYPEASHAVLFMVTRNSKALGWMCAELQRDRYGKLEAFIWSGWDIPLRERTAEDDVDGARDQLHEYIRLWAKTQGCYRIACLSPRPLERLGWIKGHTTYYQLV